jgi:hypothetical protein
MQKKAVAKVMGLLFSITYKQGKENEVGDALSRVGHLFATHLISEVKPLWL